MATIDTAQTMEVGWCEYPGLHRRPGIFSPSAREESPAVTAQRGALGGTEQQMQPEGEHAA